MYWSNYGLGEYLGTLADSGFVVLETSSTACGFDETGQETVEDHPLVLARRRPLQTPAGLVDERAHPVRPQDQ